MSAHARLAVLAIVAGLALGLLARDAAAQPAQTPLHVSADRMSGTRGPEGDIILLEGNVRITRGRAVITSKRGRYLREQGMVFLEDDVRMVDGTTVTTCDRASYSEADDVLRLEGRVKVVDREATLEAPWATYDRGVGRVEMYGGAQARDRRQTMRADSVTYLRDDQLLEARGNVRGVDEQQELVLTARAVDYDRTTAVAEAWGDPKLVSTEGDGPPTTIEALRLVLDGETRVAEAIDSVRVQRDTMHARADYGRFEDESNYGLLTGSPRAWDNETTVSGDTLEIHTTEDELDRVVVLRNATVVYRGITAQTRGEESRLLGDRIDVWFLDDAIDSLVATGSASNEYRGVERSGRTPEFNLARGDTITVFFDDREVDRAVVQGNAQGEYRFAKEVPDTAAADTSAGERVRYVARRIEYQVAKDRIVLDPGASLNYGDLELVARRVVFDLDDQTLTAQGDPELMDRGEKVTGRLMTYDLETRIGNIFQAETEYEAGLYHGERIRKVSEKELQVLQGQYSTCDLPEPHYHFAARYMKIYLKDKLVAKPIVFYVKNVPLLALPFWLFPVNQGRHSGFLFPQFELGFNNSAGQFIRNAGYYWAPNDYVDFTVSGDYYQAEPSWVLRGESVYKLLYVLDGEVSGSFARSEGDDPREEWDFTAYHTHELSPRTRLNGRASFVSSRDYSSSNQFGRSFYQRLERFLTSDLTVSHNAEWASFDAFVSRRQDLDADDPLADPLDVDGPRAPLPNLQESLPRVAVSFPTRTAGSLGILRGSPLARWLASTYVTLSARYHSQKRRFGFVEERVLSTTDPGTDSILVIGQQETTRRGAQGDFSVSDARRAFGWLNLRPTLSSSVALFDRDVLGNELVPTGTWSSGLTASTTFYGTFLPKLGRLTGLRHVLFPTVSVSYAPEFRHLVILDSLGRPRDRFEEFEGIGVSGFETFRMNFGLDQRLQVKYRNRKGEEQRLDNLLAWSMGASYDFLWRERNLRHPLSTIGSIVTLQPPRWANATLTFTTDVYERRPVRNLSYNVGVYLSSNDARAIGAPELAVERTDRRVEPFADNWNVRLAYSYAGGYNALENWSTSRNANAVLSYQISPGWGLEYSAAYDVSRQEIGTQFFSVTRDLHCWQASFTRTFSEGGDAEYYFRLGVKEQKEIFVERGTRTGSIGGIQ